MIEYNKNFNEKTILPFFIHPQVDLARGQVPFCHKSIVNFFEKRKSPCTQKFLEVKIKRQIHDHYLICKITLFNVIFTIKIISRNPDHEKYQIQTDVTDIEFSKVFKEYIKIYKLKTHKKQIQYSQTMYL